jgi:hypothetical protein
MPRDLDKRRDPALHNRPPARLALTERFSLRHTQTVTL